MDALELKETPNSDAIRRRSAPKDFGVRQTRTGSTGYSFFPDKRVDVVDYYTHLSEDMAEDQYVDEDDLVAPDGPRSAGRKCWAFMEKVRSFTPSLWFYLAFLGMICALVGYGVDRSVSGLVSVRETLSLAGGDDTGTRIGNWLTFVVISCVYVCIAASVGHLIARSAEGSGIPEMKAYLGGATMSHYLDFKVLIAKVTGLIFSLASTVSIGKEGPFVHIAACIANSMFKLPWFASMGKNPALRRQMLAASVAAGVAMAFGTPIGGVLFSIEVTATYFLVSNLWKVFYCVTWVVFFVGTFHIIGTVELFDTTEFEQYRFGWELLAYAFLGILAGFIGSLFNYVSFLWMRLRDSPPKPHPQGLHMTPWSTKIKIYTSRVMNMRYAYSLLVTFVISGLSFYVHFIHQSDRETINEMFRKDSLDKYGYQHWTWPSLLGNFFLFLIAKFILTSLSITLPIPNGVLTPVFAMGAVFGRFYGEALKDAVPENSGPEIFPGTYAMVGAAAFTSAVTRTLSIVIIVFEITGQLSHMLPVLVAVLVAYSISGGLSLSIYDVILNIKGLPYLPFMHREAYSKIVAAVVNRDVSYLTKATTYRDIMQQLAVRSYDAFPLVVSDQDHTLLGSIQRDRLVNLVYRREDRFGRRLSDGERKYLNEQLDSRNMIYTSRARVHWTTRATSASISAFRRLRERVTGHRTEDDREYVSLDMHAAHSQGSSDYSGSGAGSSPEYNGSLSPSASPSLSPSNGTDAVVGTTDEVSLNTDSPMPPVSLNQSNKSLLARFDEWMNVPFNFDDLPPLAIDEAPLQVQLNTAVCVVCCR